MKAVSIVIVNWNTRTLLFNLLTSLFEHAPHVDFEVIVVDNASTDGSREMVAADFPRINLLVNTSNLGFAKAVNLGIQESCGQYVLLLNTDLVVLDGSIDTQIEFMEANPGCAMCGGLLLDDRGLPHDVYGRFPSVKNLLAEVIPDRIKFRDRISRAPEIDQTHVMPVDFVSGADLMVRRAFFESAGLFDEQFFMYFEDADWAFRAKQLGWDVLYVPSVRYIHFGAGSIGWSGVKKHWIPSLGLYLRKHYHGAQYVTFWLLWQFLRVRYVWSMIQMRVQQKGLEQKTDKHMSTNWSDGPISTDS